MLGLAVAALALPLLVHAIIPQSIDGAFSLAHSAHAQTDSEGGVLHDPTIDLLEAATNPDPNPNKSGEHEMEVAGGVALLTHADLPEEGQSTGAVLGTTSAKPKQNEISVYTVQEGDSLSEIAEEHGVSINTILWANDIRDASTIRIGDELIILPVSGVRHTVKSGDNLSSIAKKYGSNAEDIALYNGMEVGDVLKIDTEVIIPDGAFPSSAGTRKASSPVKTGSSPAKSSSGSGTFSNPLPGAPITQANHGYNAVDLDGETGDPIYASASGTVIVAKGSGWNGGYGTYVVIDHGGGVQTLYAHMSSLEVSGGTIGKGDVLGYVGNTGKSTGSHLHFEVRGAKNPL